LELSAYRLDYIRPAVSRRREARRPELVETDVGAVREAIAGRYRGAVTGKRFATETALEARRVGALDGREPRVWESLGDPPGLIR
jgi:hypothetical protein